MWQCECCCRCCCNVCPIMLNESFTCYLAIVSLCLNAWSRNVLSNFVTPECSLYFGCCFFHFRIIQVYVCLWNKTKQNKTKTKENILFIIIKTGSLLLIYQWYWQCPPRVLCWLYPLFCSFLYFPLWAPLLWSPFCEPYSFWILPVFLPPLCQLLDRWDQYQPE